MTVEIKGLTKIFGTQKAVNDISFSADKGQILGFLGPNGAGKSTTMKMITSYLKPDQGQISICGLDTQTQSLETRKLIGYLPEHNPLYLDMYVKEYLNFVCDIHKIKSKNVTVNNIIEQVGLGKEQHKLIGALSKGYRQRVGLAQAMMHDPEVLILDEPTSGLDMNQLQDIRALIRGLGDTKTIIFSTHIMQEVQALCDRVVIINNGQLVADDPISMLSQRISGERVLFVELAKWNGDIAPFEKLNGVSQVTKHHDQLTITHAPNIDIREAVYYTCVDLNTPILSMKAGDFNVEDVFQKLTKN